MFGFSQNSDSLIVDVYGQANYLKWKSTDPALITLMKNYILEGISIQESNEKYNDSPMISQVKLKSKEESFVTIEEFLLDFNSHDFNPLKYEFFPNNSVQIFRIPGNKIIVIENQTNLK